MTAILGVHWQWWIILFCLTLAALIFTVRVHGWVQGKRHPIEYPVRPTGFRVEHADGTVSRPPLAYAGVEDGIHVWAAPLDFTAGDSVKVDVLPPQTAIRLDSGGTE